MNGLQNCIYIFVVYAQIAVVYGYLVSSEYNALHDFYDSTNGGNWVYKNSSYGAEWNFDTNEDPCVSNWQGLTCNQDATQCDSSSNNCFVTSLDLQYYNLSGSLPSTISMLNYSVNWYLNNNNLSGSIPTTISYDTMPYLVILQLYSNKMTSTVPSGLCSLTQLVVLNLQQNSLQGSLPINCLDTLISLQIFNVASNSLTGNVPWPSSTSTSSSLVYYNAESNSFVGSLPTELSMYSSLQSLIIASNSIGGTIPTSINVLSNLTSILANNNEITGTLPVLSSLSKLETFSVGVNSLRGPLDNVFSSGQSRITMIDISANGFTNSIPSGIFMMASLQIFSASQNCISGEIPNSICSASALRTLALDGLNNNARFCSALKMWFAESHLSNTVSGGIPSCVWTLPEVSALHMAGNGFVGTIDQDMDTDLMNISDSLVNVSLSYNRFTGSIPTVIQSTEFNYFDISHNKISGTGAGLTSNSNNVTYEVNRLSGFLPSDFIETTNVNVLLGNLFNCIKQTDLPEHDPHYSDYSCGSNELNQSMISMGAVVLIVIVAILGLRYYERKTIAKRLLQKHLSSNETSDLTHSPFLVLQYWIDLHKWLMFRLEEMQREGFHNLHHFIELNIMCRQTATYMVFFMMLVIFPTYYGLKLGSNGKYSTHTYQYSWTPTAAFMTGTSPAAAILALWCVLSYFMLTSFGALTHYSKTSQKWIRLEHDQLLMEERAKKLREDRNRQQQKKRVVMNAQEIEATQIGTGFIETSHNNKSCLNRCRIFGMSFLFAFGNAVVVLSVNIGYVVLTLSDSSQTTKILAQVGLAAFKLLWNNGIVPTCIQYFSSGFEVLSSNAAARIRLHVIVLLFNSVIAPCLAAASTSPACFQGLLVENSHVTSSFTYSYCSNYGYNNDLSSCVSMEEVAVNTSYAPGFLYYYQCGSALIISYVPVYIYSYLVMAFILPLCYGAVCLIKLKDLPSQYLAFYGVLWPENTQAEPYDLLRADDVISYLIHHFVVLMTFGLASPALACIIWVAICTTTWQWEILIARYLKYSPRSDIMSNVNKMRYFGNDAEKDDCTKKNDSNEVQSEATEGDVAKDETLSVEESVKEVPYPTDEENRDYLICLYSMFGDPRVPRKPGYKDPDRVGGLEESCKLIWKGPLKSIW